MAFEIPGFVLTRPLADPGALTEADLNYRFATIDGNGDAARAADNAIADGVIQPPASITIGAETPLMNSGVSKVVAGAALAAGAQVTSDAEGRARAIAAGENVNGKTLEAAGGAGTVIAVLLKV